MNSLSPGHDIASQWSPCYLPAREQTLNNADRTIFIAAGHGQLSASEGVVTLTQTFGYFQCSVNPESAATPGNRHLTGDSLLSDQDGDLSEQKCGRSADRSVDRSVSTDIGHRRQGNI